MTLRRKSCRGINSVSILLLTMLILGLVLTTLTISSHGPMFAGRTWAQSYASDAADSVIYMAISELKEGKIEFDEDLTYEVEPEKIFGTMTFNSESEKPYSTNNLVGNTKKIGWNGAAVPAGFCHLVAVGHHHGHEVVRAALVKDPPYPYSLASAGQIEGEHLEVFGLPAGEYAALQPGDELVIDEADKEPSHIVSNSTAGGADKAVTLGVDTKIAGDVKASGEIDATLAEIQGNVLPNSAEQNLPNVTIESFDPEGKDGKYDWTGAPGPKGEPPSLVGRARYSGNLTIGDLEMAEGLLYVDGNVTVTGKVSGKGAIVATGKITVTGTMDTQADHAALVAKDDITIHGNGPNSSKFQGLVYSEGSIDIARTTIMGAAVSKDSAGTTKLEEVKAIAIPELTAMNFDIHLTLEEAKKSTRLAYIGGGDPIGIRQADGTFTQLTPNPNNEALQALGAALAGSNPGPDTWQFGSMSSGDFDPSINGRSKDFLNAKTKWESYVKEHESGQPKTEEIFNIDLNTLISLDVELEMMYHTTVRTDEQN
jgi:hypothetical protein